MNAKIKNKIVSKLMVSIDLDLDVAKSLTSQLYKVLKSDEFKDEVFIEELREFTKSLSESLDERNLY